MDLRNNPQQPRFGAFGHPEAIGGPKDDTHIRKCRAKRCARCTWLRNKDDWGHQCGEWFEGRYHPLTKRWGLGCLLCAAASEMPDITAQGLLATHSTGFAKFRVTSKKTPLKQQRLLQHTKSPGHQAAVELLACGEVPATAPPCTAHWRAVYDHLQSNPTSIHGVPGVGGRDKVCKMQWCLAEAKRAATRAYLKDAVCVAVSQDKRNTRFLMRFRCADANLEVHEGTLCLRREVGEPGCVGSDALRTATLRGLQDALTPTRGPKCPQIRGEALDTTLLKQVIGKVECFAADGASEEQLAGRELASGLQLAGPTIKVLDTLMQSLPNLRVPLW